MFQTLFYQPILNLLVFLYNIIPGHDIGLVIIALSIVIKAVLYPLSGKALKAQLAMQNLQPKMDEIKETHKDNKEAMSRAMMELYKTEKINPFSSCLPLLIQLPFLWAVFQVFRTELLNKNLTLVYPFVHNPGSLDHIAFGFLNLADKNIYLAVLAGLAQFAQVKLMPKPKAKPSSSKEASMSAIMNKQMTYFMPVMTVVICMGLPAGLAFYWFLTTLLTIAQQLYVFRKHRPNSGQKAGNKVIEGQVTN